MAPPSAPTMIFVEDQSEEDPNTNVFAIHEDDARHKKGWQAATPVMQHSKLDTNLCRCW